MSSTLKGLTAYAAAMLVFWYGGVDFNERGFMSAYWLTIAMVIGVAVYVMSKILKGKR